MCGETYYQMGQYAPALDQFNKALQLQINFNDWMIPVKFNPVVQPVSQVLRPIPWGRPDRQLRFRPQFHHRLRQHMSERVTEIMESIGLGHGSVGKVAKKTASARGGRLN